MYADLVGSSGERMHFDQRMVGKSFQDVVVADGPGTNYRNPGSPLGLATAIGGHGRLSS